MPTPPPSLRDRLLGLFLDNILLKGLSLCFAFSLWAWVQSEQVVQRNVRAQVVYTWPESRALIRADETPTRLTVTVSGPQGLLHTLKPQQLRLQVDLSDGVEGSNLVDFTTRPLEGLPDSLSVLQISPPEADILLEKPLTRTVPIKPVFVGDLPAGYELRSVKVSPEAVELIGPKSRVRNLSELPTEVIDYRSLTQSRTFNVALVTANSTLQVLYEEPIQVAVEVAQVIAPRTFNEVPVMVRGEGWIPQTRTVSVMLRGPETELRGLPADQITLMVIPPDEIADDIFTARYRDGSPSDGIQVVHPGSDAVLVERVDPARLTFTRQAPTPK